MTIVAEIGTSHQGKIEKALNMIDEAKNAGADAVKFQWVYADEILHPKTGFVNLPGGKTPLYDTFKLLECPLSFYRECSSYARKNGLLFICSPFGLRSLEELISIKPDAIKIASPELNHIPLLKEVSKYVGKIPVIISSGVSRLSDIERALEILRNFSASSDPYKNIPGSSLPEITLLHCITSYPAPEEEYNVRLVKTLSEIFGLPCGISDHSLDPVLVPVLSTALGASMIEKHITLSKKTDGLDDPVALEEDAFFLMCHSVHQTLTLAQRFKKEEEAEKGGKENIKTEITPSAFKEIIRQLSYENDAERIEKILGDGVKRLADAEKLNYGRTNRSLHFMRSMKKGEKVSKKDIDVLRTEKILSPGIGPEYLDDVLNCILTQDVEDGEGVRFSHFMLRDIK